MEQDFDDRGLQEIIGSLEIKVPDCFPRFSAENRKEFVLGEMCNMFSDALRLIGRFKELGINRFEVLIIDNHKFHERPILEKLILVGNDLANLACAVDQYLGTPVEERARDLAKKAGGAPLAAAAEVISEKYEELKSFRDSAREVAKKTATLFSLAV